jgi:hypothetical protein
MHLTAAERTPNSFVLPTFSSLDYHSELLRCKELIWNILIRSPPLHIKLVISYLCDERIAPDTPTRKGFVHRKVIESQAVKEIIASSDQR